MKIIYNKILPVKGYAAINLFGIVFARKEFKPLGEITINHEKIHTAQMRELLYIGFYVCYLAEWFVRLFMKGNAYRNISFEREAYNNDVNLSYLKRRKWFAQWR